MRAEDLLRKALSAMFFYLGLAIIVLLIFIGARQVGVNFFDLTKDPYAGAVEQTPIYISLLSNIGIMAWCFATAVQFFAAWVCRHLQPASRDASLLFWFGIITCLLMLDDFLMLHERMNHTVEAYVFGAYGLLVAVVILRFFKELLETNYLVLVGALGCFLLSMVLDNIVERLSLAIPYRTVLEDAFKIIGIAGWFTYFTGYSAAAVKRALGNVVASPH